MDITGIVLTKLDGTAKGGVILGICDELKVPVRFVGIGEKVADLRPFDAHEFVDALYEPTAGAVMNPVCDSQCRNQRIRYVNNLIVKKST